MRTTERILAQAPGAASPHGVLQRKCAGKSGGCTSCESCRDEDEVLQRSPDGSGIRSSSSVPQSIHETLASPGQPLDRATRQFMESRFAHDFSRVRVHTDARAAESARAVNAAAYTVANDVAFGAGRYAPSSESGRRLLAHELTHVVQQASGATRVDVRRIGDGTDRHEREADAASAETLAGGPGPLGGPVISPLGGVTTGIPRAPDPCLEQCEKGFDRCLSHTYFPPECFGARSACQRGCAPAPMAAPSTPASTSRWGADAFEFALGSTAGKRSVDAYYFPGQSTERALIVGGVHGSELASIEVAEILKDELQHASVKPYFSVVLVPVLFPDNRAVAEAACAKGMRKTNVGRYTAGQPRDKVHDPNRKYPKAGKAFDPSKPVAATGQVMEPEHVMLLKLIDEFHPTRVAALHSTHGAHVGGFYADPRTDASGMAKGFGPDEKLALEIATRAKAGGANVPGNETATWKGKARSSKALYPEDPAIVAAGTKQARDTESGTSSFGGWASTDVQGGRPAMTVITMEVDLGTPSKLAGNAAQQAQRLKELTARSIALREVFLGPRAAGGPP
jgi:uncharacterized protein DUF4157